jgi:PKHD-type hydroxylase
MNNIYTIENIIETKNLLKQHTLNNSYCYIYFIKESAIIFNDLECDHIVKLGNAIPKKMQQTTDNNNPFFNSNINYIIPSNETQYIYNKIYDYISEINMKYYKFNLCGFGEPVKFAEYKAEYLGGTQLHLDIIHNEPLRKLTAVVQLTNDSEYEGGELEIMISNTKHKMSKIRGSIIVFPSFLLHQVTQITKGTRNSLVAFAYGLPFC